MASTHEHGEASGDVQMFVALTHTLPSLLAGAWRALLADVGLQARLRARPDLLKPIVNELLRVAGPSRAVFREALADTVISGAAIRGGDRVVLMLSAANRDPLRFADPERIDHDRGRSGQLALGAGPHACAGASLVRMALEIATGVLLDRTAAVTLVNETATPELTGGFAIRVPAELMVVVRALQQA